jgi:hypothetical protein
MTGAGFRPDPSLPGGFRDDGLDEIPYWHMTFRAFGALNATPRAMSRLLTVLLDRGRIDGRQVVPEASVDRLFRMEATEAAVHGLQIGYGAGLYGWAGNGHLFHGHGGDADGYRSRLGLLRSAGRGYLVGINTDNPALLGRMQARIEDVLTADLPAPPSPEPVAVEPAELEALAGDYYPAAARFDVEGWRSGTRTGAVIEARRDALVWRRDSRRVRLLPLGAGRFRRTGDPAVSVVFFRHRGSLYLQGELGAYVRARPPPCPEFLPRCDSPGTRD